MRLILSLTLAIALAVPSMAIAGPTMRVEIGKLAPMLGGPPPPTMQDCPTWDEVTLEPAGTVEVPVDEVCPAEPVLALVVAETPSLKAAIDRAVSYKIVPTGGRGIVTYTPKAAVPGFSISGDTVHGLFAGTGTRSFAVDVKDGSTPPQIKTVTLDVEVVGPVIFTALPNAGSVQQGKSYDIGVRTSGGTEVIEFSLKNAPDGLTINPTTGVVSAAASTVIGNYWVSVTATDAVTGESVTTGNFQISVTTPLSSGLRATFSGGYAITFTQWTAAPSGNITYQRAGNELVMQLNLPCGYLQLATTGATFQGASWNGGPGGCASLGYSFDAYWLLQTGQVARGAVADRVVPGGSVTTMPAPSWTVMP